MRPSQLSVVVLIMVIWLAIIGCQPREQQSVIVPTRAHTLPPMDVIGERATPTPLPPTVAAPTQVTLTPSATFSPTPVIQATRPPDTPLPPPPTSPPVPTLSPSPIQIPSRPDAQVAQGSGDLRLREQPQVADNVITLLDEFAPLEIIGRTSDDFWLQVRLQDGRQGWVMAQFLEVFISLEFVTNVVAPLPTPDRPRLVINGAALSNLTSNTRAIYQRGQGRGNRANVFSKVGDSITVASYMLYPYGWGDYNLGAYGHLQAVIDFFGSATARDGNSFANNSLAAENGWTAADLLDPNRAHPTLCRSGETPLACEYRIVRPSVALIMVGTNDVVRFADADYEANLRRVLDITIQNGVVPVLSTIPPRPGSDEGVARYNEILRRLAREYSIPLWDYWAQMVNLPDQGMSSDGVHPSNPPGEVMQAAYFNPPNLDYGYTLRNLNALQILGILMQEVLY